VTFDTGSRIDYTYDATGVKQSKQVTASGVSSFTYYAGNFICEQNTTGQKLASFWHPEGYVEKNGNVFNYVYQYKDHLEDGALRKCPVDIFSERDSMPRWPRLSYKNTSTTGINLAILEENNYYPFGLKHKGYNNNILAGARDHKYGFGNKEAQSELGLDWYDYGARDYNPALGRWMNVDPLAEQMRRHSPYNYAFDNPIFFIGPDGMAPFAVVGADEQAQQNIRNQLPAESQEFVRFDENGTLDATLIAEGAKLNPDSGNLQRLSHLASSDDTYVYSTSDRYNAENSDTGQN
jgi:RHS repeat-associated protein